MNKKELIKIFEERLEGWDDTHFNSAMINNSSWWEEDGWLFFYGASGAIAKGFYVRMDKKNKIVCIEEDGGGYTNISTLDLIDKGEEEYFEEEEDLWKYIDKNIAS